ncbi:MAG: DUF4249 domain-containing protein [Bacteroidales bacterium]|jgi:hypothetical protein|nr:DUF4249 domain-containing protein [Bacteroidales bacterium]
MKQKNIINILGIILTTLMIFVSCEKDISVDLPRPEEKITIEGFIDLDDYPIVFITKNSAYFDEIDTTYVENLIISGDMATVIVDNGSVFDTLVHAEFPRWPYKGYVGTKFKGQINGRYNLQIKYGENKYFSTTTIRDTIAIDSVWYSHIPLRDTIGYLSVSWRNPPGYGDYFTLTLKTGAEQKWFYRSLVVHLIDDKLLETNENITIPYIMKGYERNSYFPRNTDTTSFSERYLFQIGDTVSLKLSTIDENSYLFWNSWERNNMTDGNPFTNPASVKSNITGAPANGYWIGYGAYKNTYYINDEYEVIPLYMNNNPFLIESKY